MARPHALIRPPVRQTDVATERRLRRFAVLWLIAVAVALPAIFITDQLAHRVESAAIERRDAARTARLELARLHASLEAQAAAVQRYRLSASETDRVRFLDERDASERTGARAVTAARRAGARPAPLEAALDSLARWEDATTSALLGRGRTTGAPAVADVREELVDAEAALAADIRASVARRDQRGDDARLLAHLAWFSAIAVLLAGAWFVRQALRLARQGEAGRARQERWNGQIEAILAWAGTAKGATTRSQLIGAAHTAPKDALGVVCLAVGDGGPPPHRSHGHPRLNLEVDSSGDGLHISVCFAPGRGDELDHHALHVLIGHLSALWRTVLRHEELERAAGHDALTGLPNRRLFETELRRRIATSRRRGLPFALALVDLDHFKLVNDCLGHPAGDAVLRRTGDAIAATLRASDRVFRLGGEEFALILETGDPEGVTDLLERTRAAIKELGVEPRPGHRLSASIGWAVYPHDAPGRTDLVARADTALYAAKHGGRDRVVRADDRVAA